MSAKERKQQEREACLKAREDLRLNILSFLKKNDQDECEERDIINSELVLMPDYWKNFTDRAHRAVVISRELTRLVKDGVLEERNDPHPDNRFQDVWKYRLQAQNIER